MSPKRKKLLTKILIIIVILFIALYLFTWTGNIRCSKVPGLCGIYWGSQSLITGKSQPSVLIVYDPYDVDGLGNPYLLKKTLEDNKRVGVHPAIENINYLSPEKLNGYSLVIVEKAKQISTKNLETFMNYVSKGGRLIWIGDAGTEISKNEDKLLTTGDIEGTYDSNIIGGWARLNNDNYMIRFDEFLEVRYITTYCQIKECIEKEYKVPGYNNQTIIIKYPDHINGKLVPSSKHPLVYALKDYLPTKDDFAIVELLRPVVTPLKLDFGSNLYNNIDKDVSFGQNGVFPLIVVSNSNRVVYYALPPEYLIEEDDETGYFSIIENIISGMLK